MGTRAALAVGTVGVLAGQIAAVQSPWAPVALMAVAGASTAAWCASGRRHSGLLWLALALVALATGLVRMRAVHEPRLAPDHVARLALPLRTLLVAEVVAAPERRGERTVLVVDARRADGVRVSGRVRLTIAGPRQRWRYGDRLRAPVVLRRPRNFENPGRFDRVGYLARRGVYVTAFVWEEATVARWPRQGRDPRARLEAWRTRLAEAIARAAPGPEGPVLCALVTGDAGSVDSNLRQAFVRAGVAHVLSVSGLHVAIVAGTAFALVRWLLGRSERLLLAIDVERAASVVSLGPVLVYAAVAGLQVATLRAALMVAAVVAIGLIGRRVDVLATLVLAALAIALAWPGTPREAGFQLSFVSVLAIVVGARRLGVGRPGRPRWLVRLQLAVAVSICASFGTAPVLALHFHQLSLIGPIANLPLVPVFSVSVVAALAGALLEPVTPAGAHLLFQGAAAVLRPSLALVEAFAAPSWAAVDVPIPTAIEVALLYALLGGLVMLPLVPARALVALAAVGLVIDAGWWVHRRSDGGWLRVTFLDVGQGDAAVVELPGGGVIVVDGGGLPGGDFDTGAAILAPFLWARKITRVDAVVMTHAHPDHAAGLSHLLRRHRPREFWWTGVAGTGQAWAALQAALAGSGARVRVLPGDGMPPDMAAWLRVLHPPPGPWQGSLNDSSLTLKVDHGAFSALLTGDIEAGAESRLLGSATHLESTVLKVPHHGSRTSSTPAFLKAVAPSVAVVSVGADNRYRLPAPEVEARYRALGVCLLRTDQCGAVTVETDGRRLRLYTHRPGCVCAPGAPTAVGTL